MSASATASAPPPVTGRWRTAWITGASTGIGRELALQLAARGVRVAVSARSADALADLAAAHAGITPFSLDVTDLAAARTAAAAVHAHLGSIDLVILCAGVWDPMGSWDYQAERATHSMAVNYTGIVNVLDPILPLLRAQSRGQIALMASLAGYRGIPNAAAYAPSKAAVISLAESLRPDLRGTGTKISVINTGFVATPMTAHNTFPMPQILPAAVAATRILRGLDARRFEIAFPWLLAHLANFLRKRSYLVYFWAIDRFVLPYHNSLPTSPQPTTQDANTVSARHPGEGRAPHQAAEKIAPYTNEPLL